MKNELEKITGPMHEETKRVQQKALEQYDARNNRKKKIKWGYPIVLVLFFGMLVILNPLQKTEETASNVYIEPINEQLFWLGVYSFQYDQGQFWTKANAIENSFAPAIRRSALLSYAKHLNVEIDQELITKGVKQLLQHEENGTIAKIKNEKLLQTFNLTKEDYKEIIVQYVTANSVIESVIKDQGLKGARNQLIGQIEHEALTFYELHAAEEIEKFEAKQRATVTEKPPLIEVQTPETFRFAGKEHLALDIGLNEQQQYEFMHSYITLTYIGQTYGELIYEAAPNKQHPFELGPLFYMGYKRNIEQLAEQPKWREQALEVLEILEIFERSYIDDYPFLQ